MKQRPVFFSIYAIGMVLAAIAIFATDFVTRYPSLSSISATLLEIDSQVAYSSLILLMGALLSLRASKFFRIFVAVFLVAALCIGPELLNSVFSLTPAQIRAALILVMLSHTPLGFGRTRRVFFNSRLRWWMIEDRKILSLPVAIKTVKGIRITANSFDVSNGGMFVNIDRPFFDHGSSQALRGMIEGSRASLRIMLSRFHEIQCEAQIVRTQASMSGQYPSGLAFRFVNLSLKDRIDLGNALHHLGQQSPSRI